jgi:hypothetical protein
MRYRPRWALLTLGALVVVALFTYPFWRSVFMRPVQSVPFGQADPAQREVLLRMADRNLAATAYAAMLTVVPVPTEMQPPALPAEAVAFITAEIKPIDAVHNAEGRAVFYRLVDGRVLLRLNETFKVSNAPGLMLYLSEKPEPRLYRDLGGVVPEYVVGPLKGSVGAQQFNIPQELRLERYRSIVVVSDGLQTIYGSGELQ